MMIPTAVPEKAAIDKPNLSNVTANAISIATMSTVSNTNLSTVPLTLSYLLM